MRTDFVYRTVTSAIDDCVEKVLPRATCGLTRWLSFDLEAVADPSLVDNDDRDGTPDSFRYFARYSRPAGYTHWQIVLQDGVPHRKVQDHCDDKDHPTSPWVPLDSTNPDFGKRVYGELLTAPGYVVADGAHDSCWRDHGMEYQGYPRIDTGRTWKRDDNGWTGKVYDQTNYFYWPKAATVRVYSVRLDGEIKSQWGSELPEGICNGEWVNPDPDTLTGPWAVLAATGALYHCSGEEGPLEFGLDTRVEYFKVTEPGDDPEALHGRLKLTQTTSFRDTLWVRLNNEGKVTATGKGRVSWEVEWADAEEPFTLTRELHLRLLGVSETKIKAGLVGFRSWWAR